MSLPDSFPARIGPRPSTTEVNPHTQVDQNAPAGLQDQLRDHALSLPGVRAGTSNVSVPGAVAFFLDQPPRRQRYPMCSAASGATSIPATTEACT